jgi:serine/threonine-protein phosphatase PP1 catalytic subunit
MSSSDRHGEGGDGGDDGKKAGGGADAGRMAKRLLQWKPPGGHSAGGGCGGGGGGGGGGGAPAIALTLAEVRPLCDSARALLEEQGPVVHLSSPITICGDVHGQMADLLRVFQERGVPSADSPYLFLGDYVDRGDNSIDVIMLLLALKVRHPHHVFLLRGNHECPEINSSYGFVDECRARFGSVDGPIAWRLFNDVFKWLPLCATVDNRIFCVHGGLSPELLKGRRDGDDSSIDVEAKLRELESIDRRALGTVPDRGLVCDMLWSDPDPNASGWEENDRGCGYIFDGELVKRFCDAYGYDFVCRAHQCVDYGYDFFSSRRLVTVFTASNYCGSYNNCGCVLSVDRDRKCKFHILLPDGKIDDRPLVLDNAQTPPTTPRRATPPSSPRCAAAPPPPPPPPRPSGLSGLSEISLGGRLAGLE